MKGKISILSVCIFYPTVPVPSTCILQRYKAKYVFQSIPGTTFGTIVPSTGM